MSIEIVIYPPKASKEALRKHILSLGFYKCGHLWKWPKGALHFAWFEPKDFQSIDGMEATIFKPEEEASKKFGGGEWAVHTRTRLGASSFDQEKQNEVIRSLRQKFGGNFHNDWYGKNRYIKVEKDLKGPAGRGIWSNYEMVSSKLDAVLYSLPEPGIKVNEQGKLEELMRRIDPSRVLYNALIPFAVAALEHFFGRTFSILLRYDHKAKEKLKELNRKIEISEAIAISSGEKTIEEIVAGWYSFQNVASIHKAFNEWFSIDFRKLLRRKRKTGRSVLLLEDKLTRLIERRHGVIHHFAFDEELNKKQIVKIIKMVKVLIDTLIDHLEKDRGIKIRD